jgi:enediyne biosynthesis thioesterase
MGSNYYEHRHRVTFADTNAVGNVYFAHYFFWQGECREAVLAEQYPEFEQDLRKGFGFITEFAAMDYHHEARLFDDVVVRMFVTDLTRTRIELRFEFLRGADGVRLAEGRQAVVWVNQQQRPSLMPDKLHEAIERLSQTS